MLMQRNLVPLFPVKLISRVFESGETAFFYVLACEIHSSGGKKRLFFSMKNPVFFKSR